MIQPLPQQPPAGKWPERDVKNAAKAAQDDFAAMLTDPVGAIERPLAPVFPDHGPAIVSVGELVMGAAMIDPAEQLARPAGVEPSAHIFNRDGFFGATVVPLADSPSVAGDVVVPKVATSPTDVEASTKVAVEPEVGMTIPNRAATSGGAGARPAHAVRFRSVTASNTVVMPMIARAPAQFVGTDEEADSVGAAQRRVKSPALTKNSLQVAISELEHGVRIAVSAGALDPVEREQLRREIAQLLSRHGLAPRAIQIFAPLARTLSDRSQK